VLLKQVETVLATLHNRAPIRLVWIRNCLRQQLSAQILQLL